MQGQNIKSAVINELLRIGCFLLYYLLLIALGVIIVIGSFWGVISSNNRCTAGSRKWKSHYTYYNVCYRFMPFGNYAGYISYQTTLCV